VLLSGENPLLATAKANPPAMNAGDVENNGDMGMMAAAPRRPGNGQGGGARQNPLGRPNASLPPLTGLAQVVGLALGSPEFQRR